ncbi:hypothetical protein, partial [Methylophaga sp. UBA5088]
MINLTDPMLEFLAYELALIFAVIAGILLISNRKKRRKVHNAGTNAVKKIKRDQISREQNLSQVLHEKYALSDEALKAEVNDFLERERRIQKSLIKTYIEQDDKAFLAIPGLVEQAVDAALNIEPVGSHAKSQQSEETAPTADDLQQQIDHAAQTMERLLSQYQQLTGASMAAAAVLPTEKEDVEIDESVTEEETPAEIDEVPEPQEEQTFGDGDEINQVFDDQAEVPSLSPETDVSEPTEPEDAADTDTPNAEIPANNDSSPEEEPILSNEELDALLDGDDFSLEDENASVSDPDNTNETRETEIRNEPVDVVEINGIADEADSVQQEELTDEELQRFTEVTDEIEIPGAVDDILSSLQDNEEKQQTSVETDSDTEIDNEDNESELTLDETITDEIDSSEAQDEQQPVDVTQALDVENEAVIPTESVDDISSDIDEDGNEPGAVTPDESKGNDESNLAD